MIGKPYSGKPNVRFDEGELEIGQGLAVEALPSKEAETDRLNLIYYASSLLYNVNIFFNKERQFDKRS